jgi:hypothetical protein
MGILILKTQKRLNPARHDPPAGLAITFSESRRSGPERARFGQWILIMCYWGFKQPERPRNWQFGGKTPPIVAGKGNQFSAGKVGTADAIADGHPITLNRRNIRTSFSSGMLKTLLIRVLNN